MKTFLFSLIMAVLCITAKAQTTPPTAISTVTCGCSTTGWSPILTYVESTKSYVNCGYQFGVKKGQTVKMSGTYTCSGRCAPKYILILKKADGTIISNTSSSTMTWNYLFATPGGYRLEVTPICNGNKCATCTFYFTVYA
jgi:hypothetical protein